MSSQKTVKSSIVFEGKGIHTGQNVKATLHPMPADSGISFCRADLDPDLKVRASVEHVCQDELRQTALKVGKGLIKTIEHLMAALHGLGVDNALVEVGGEELPAMDGSALEYTQKIIEVGLQDQGVPRRYIEVDQPVVIDHGDQSLMIVPDKNLSISYTLSYQHEDLNDQFFSLSIVPEIFERELASARTFCLKDEAHALLAQGFGKGANVENTLVFEKNAPIDNELRFSNEACRHKIMDLLGDLYLAGGPIRGHIIATRSGHSLNLELVRKLVMVAKDKKSEVPSMPSEMNIQEIQKIIPHRYPFLFVDRIKNFEPGKRATGYKQVTMNDYFFKGHFPGHPVMPGVLIIEAMAQVGGVIMLGKPENHGKIAYFMSLDKAKFRAPVVPGDELRMEIEVQKIRARTGQCSGKAYVGEKLVCEAEVKFAVVDA